MLWLSALLDVLDRQDMVRGWHPPSPAREKHWQRGVLLPVRDWMAAVQRLKPRETGDEAVGGMVLASQHMQKRRKPQHRAGMSIVFVGMQPVQVLLGTNCYRRLGGCTFARLVY